jgi:DNA helicase-2/ATP-dependent DNA helicase PcrA
MSALLDDLTPAQREAVQHRDGPLLVVAGAGSGKTRVITRRVAYLVEQGISPRNILAITFTNKAAGEMRERIEKLLGEKTPVTVSTFHSLCARLLRRWATRLGYEPGFAILDAADQRSAVREALVEVAADIKQFAPPKVSHAIGRAKDRLESPKDLAGRATGRFETVVAKAFEVYQDLLKQRNAFDFDDLLTKTVELIRDHEDACEALQDRFRYILIDEYQDTNHAQYQLAQLLAKQHRNLNATGDPDQSIYGWRGADIGNILRFEKDFPGAKVVLLEKNYRSTNTVCRAANGLIKHNKRRKEKTLVTENEEGAPVELHAASDDTSEARHVGQRIEDLVQRDTKRDEIAVFFRTNALSRSVEQELRMRNIPYVVVGALSFYERKEVKDVLAYLRVLANPRDDASTIRVIQTPPRGVGTRSIERLRALASEHAVPLIDAIRFADQIDELPKKARAGLRALEETFDRLRARLQESAENLVRAVVGETNYLAYLQQEYPEEEDRASNVEALVAGAREFDKRTQSIAPPRTVRTAAREKVRKPQGSLFAEPETPETLAFVAADDDDVLAMSPGLQGFLEQISLLAEEEAAEDQDVSEKVQLMTVHTAKGLEFDHVFIIGLEDGLFPNARAMEEPEGVEEERRLAYVALTRAKKRLYLSYANERSRFGKTASGIPSGFLFEIPGEVFEAGKAPRDHQPHGQKTGAQVWDDEDVQDEGLAEVQDEEESFDDGQNRLWDRPLAGAPKKKVPNEARAVVEKLAERARATAPARDEDFAVGDRVKHEHFGVGKVLETSGQGMARRLKIQFIEYGVKTLVLNYARITKVGS